jgi:type I restriction enzyme M protein
MYSTEIDRIAKRVDSREKAFALVDTKLVRFYPPLKPPIPTEPVRSVIRRLADKIGERPL